MSYHVIKASEISEYLYCRRAWWLRKVGGHRPRNSEELTAGSAHHERHGRQVQRASRLQRAALVLVFLAVSAIIFWLFGAA